MESILQKDPSFVAAKTTVRQSRFIEGQVSRREVKFYN